MDERLTDRAKFVMKMANQEAQRFNHEYISTAHVLLGLIKEGKSVAAVVLKQLGVELRKTRMELEKLAESGPDLLTTGKLPSTPRTKKLIQRSLAESCKLGHDEVAPEHILLGLLRDHECLGAHVLTNLCVAHDEVRKTVLKLLLHTDGGTDPN